jgi:cytochrome c553
LLKRYGVGCSLAVLAASLVLIAASRGGEDVPIKGAAVPDGVLPIWAYPVLPPAPPRTGPRPAATPDETLRHVPGSSAGYTRAQIGTLFGVPDWFPDAHPKMPAVVSEGRKPDVGACGHCHLPNGYGRAENSSVEGLPPEYMMQQIEDFKSGARQSSEPRLASVTAMTAAAKAATPEETKAAVAYFASIKPAKWIRVVEADEVPKTHVASLTMVVDQPASTEPIGRRVIEVAEDFEQFELRNPQSGFVAYAPVGSLKKGEALAKKGSDKVMACVACHGANLKGAGQIPSIAGRSPSTMTRQLIDFQTGARNGPNAAMMKPVVAQMTNDDIVALTAYLASLEP